MKYKTLALAGCALSVVTLTAATAADLSRMDSRSGVTLTGTVAEIRNNNQFLLNYGNGTIAVETEQVAPGLFNRGVADKLQPGEMVTVSGWLDDSWYAGRDVKAHTVVRNSDNQIFTSLRHIPDYYVSYYQPQEGFLVLTGNITSVNGEEFTLDYGQGRIRIDAGEMRGGNALTGLGQTFNPGDRVVVTGWMNDSVFQTREVRATDILRMPYETASR